MLSGNKGEWSEIYVFLKLLADGKLHAADANLDAIPNVYYPIIKILREEGVAKKEYILNGNEVCCQQAVAQTLKTRQNHPVKLI